MSKKISLTVIFFAVLVATTYVAYAAIFPSYTWRYKITVNVETPEGLKTGWAVREVTNHDNTIFGVALPDVGARISSVKGEAVVVDLGKRGVIFGLIENGSYGELYSAFSVKGASQTADDLKKLKTGLSAALQESDWPQFVIFTDIKDPKSVILVHGRRFDIKAQDMLPVDDTEKIFGDGVKISNIKIYIVDQPVTWGIEERLIWLPIVKKGSLDGKMATVSTELSNILHHGNFKQGE